MVAEVGVRAKAADGGSPSRANVARERLALTPALSRKRERETDS